MSEESKQIQAALMGSPSAFEYLIPLYSRKLFSIAFAIVQDAKDAEEVVKDVFLTAFKDRYSIHSAEDFPLWLVNTTRHKARDLQRKHHHLERDPVPRQLLDWPEPEREAVTLRFLDKIEPANIERRLALETGGFYRALAKLLSVLRGRK